MKRLVLLLPLLALPLLAFAQDGDGPVHPTVIDPGPPGGAPPSPAVPVLGIGLARQFYDAVRAGQGWLAAALLLFLVVGAILMFGRKLYDAYPEGKFWDPPLRFLFATKIGGWLWNWFMAVAGCLGVSYAAGVPIDMGAWRVAIMASTSSTALIELWKDIKEWMDNRKKAADPHQVPPPAP